MDAASNRPNLIECKELALEEAVLSMDLLLRFQYILPVVNFLSND